MALGTVNEKKGEGKKTAGDNIVEIHPSAEGSSFEPAKGNNRDLHGGMELLELDFMLGIVENTKGDDQNDVTMRRLNFNEVLRREKQSQIDSSSLVVYAMNAGDLYGKDIQCAATKELTKRTAK